MISEVAVLSLVSSGGASGTRLTMLEGERDAFHERFNQIQLNITSALAENRNNHLEANTRRAQAQSAPGS